MARQPRRTTMPVAVCRLGLALAIFMLAAASAAHALVCNDLPNVPTLGNDTVPGYIPAGPELLSTGEAGTYNYVVNSATDNLEFFVVSAPGVGTSTAFTRKLWIALSGTNTTSFYTVATDPVCQVFYPRFTLASPVAGVTISANSSDITNSATGTEDHCFFNHQFSISWADFRNASLAANCGFTVTDNSSLANGTYRTYSGRIHVKWEDYDTYLASTPVRPNMTTWYDVTVQIQVEANSTSNATANTEIPYQSDFKVSSITYSKDAEGLVTANIAYQLSTNFPYYAAFPSTQPFDYLVHSGAGSSATYAGLALGESSSTSFPGGTWSNTFTSNGTLTGDGTPCDTVGENCVMQGILSYQWTPTPSKTASCSISSNTAYQFDFVLQCSTSYNGTIGSSCGTAMRDALALPNFGSFKFSGNVNFCKSAATDFPLSWTQNFDVMSSSRSIGQTITAAGAFTVDKMLSAVAIKEFRVARSDLSGFWSMWTAAGDSATASASSGSRSAVGDNVQFGASIDPSNSGKQWAISTSFTPNIKMYSGVQSNFNTVSSRGAYLISLPNDKGQSISFRITMVVRLYADSTQTFAKMRKRRFAYRDAIVQAIKGAAAVSDLELTTGPVGMKVPDNIQVSKDGSVTVLQTSSLSIGAIAGIAAMGAIVGSVLVTAGILIVRRRQRNAERAAKATVGMEAAWQAGSTDFLSGRSSEFLVAGEHEHKLQPIVPVPHDPSHLYPGFYPSRQQQPSQQGHAPEYQTVDVFYARHGSGHITLSR